MVKPFGSGLASEEAIEEANRCLNCGGCSDCGECAKYCQPKTIVYGMKDRREGEVDLKFFYCLFSYREDQLTLVGVVVYNPSQK
jgi:hypothetical protein